MSYLLKFSDGSLYPLVKTHPVCVNVSSQEKIKDNIIKISMIIMKNFQNIKKILYRFLLVLPGDCSFEKLKILHICFDRFLTLLSFLAKLNVKKLLKIKTFIQQKK